MFGGLIAIFRMECKTYLATKLSKIPILTPRSRVLLEKLTGSQLAKKFPAFLVTPRFIPAFKSARHLSLS